MPQRVERFAPRCQRQQAGQRAAIFLAKTADQVLDRRMLFRLVHPLDNLRNRGAGSGDRSHAQLEQLRNVFFRDDAANEHADAAFIYQKSVDKREKIIVGVNAFEEDEQKSIDILQIDEGPEEEQLRNLARAKKNRNNSAVERGLAAVKRAAERKENVFPALMDAASARATVYETMSALADVLGRLETGGLS